MQLALLAQALHDGRAGRRPALHTPHLPAPRPAAAWHPAALHLDCSTVPQRLPPPVASQPHAPTSMKVSMSTAAMVCAVLTFITVAPMSRPHVCAIIATSITDSQLRKK